MSPSATLTVCVVDDDPQVRRFLVKVLNTVGIACQEYASGEDFMRHWQPGEIGCVLLDIRMPRITGPEIHDWLRQRSPNLPVIFLSGYADVPTAVRAMRLGAFDVIEKPVKAQHLIERVNHALHLAAERCAVNSHDANDWRQSLTPREQEVLMAIVAGRSNKRIANDLGISERTVETHRASIMAKAKAANTAHLVAMTVNSAVS